MPRLPTPLPLGLGLRGARAAEITGVGNFFGRCRLWPSKPRLLLELLLKLRHPRLQLRDRPNNITTNARTSGVI